MTWLKLVDDAVDHPKVAALSDGAFRWWIRCLCHASHFLTDGVLSPAFWKQIPKRFLVELETQRLLEQHDPNFMIHGYLQYQSSKADVERKKQHNRAKSARYRGGEPATTTDDVTGNDTGSDTGNDTGKYQNQSTESRDQIHTETRDQRADTESRGQQRQQSAPPPRFEAPAYDEGRHRQCAYVGKRLEVPHGLHADFQRLLGGPDADVVLMAWYGDVDDDIVASGETIAPDVFRWLKARYAAWRAVAMNGTSVNDQRFRLLKQKFASSTADPVAVQQAIDTRRRRAEMEAKGMADDQIDAVFNREYEERKLRQRGA